MFTEIIVPRETSVTLNVPRKMVGHRVRITLDDMEGNPRSLRARTAQEALAQFSAPRLDTRGWKFNRDEANER
jgi:hypothetical protein